jgi:hypothetical protein
MAPRKMAAKGATRYQIRKRRIRIRSPGVIVGIVGMSMYTLPPDYDTAGKGNKNLV